MVSSATTSLQRRITLVMMLTALTTLLSAVLALFVLEVRQFRDALARELNSIAGVTGANSLAALVFDDAEAANDTLALLKEDPRIVAAALYNAEGKVFAHYQSSERPGVVPPSVLELPNVSAHRDVISVSRPILHEGRVAGTVYVQASGEEVYERLVQHTLIAGLILIAAGLGAYVLSVRLSNVISRPILSLAETTRLVSRHNEYTIRARKQSNDEIGFLVDQFNQMLGEIGRKNQAIRESENQLRLITDSLPVLIAYVDSNQCYQFNNALYERWFKRRPDELRGMRMVDVIGESAHTAFAPYVDRVLDGEMVAFDAYVDYRDAGPRYVSCVMVPDLEALGRARGYFMLVTDITDRKRQEDELRILNEELEHRVNERTRELQESQERVRHSERLASIGTLAAGVAHEIRNPLNSILLVTQVAHRYKKEVDPAIKEMFDAISNEAKRCATILRNMLLFAKAEKTEKSPHRFNEVVRHAADLAKSYLASSKTELLLELEATDPEVNLNPTEIEQVLVNLINNASEAAQGEVKVEITTKSLGKSVQLIVSDNGPGIPEPNIRHIFDPFFSTKRQKGNTGLGLSLSHGIVADHGGTMSVESRIGEGTVFTLEFPQA